MSRSYVVSKGAAADLRDITKYTVAYPLNAPAPPDSHAPRVAHGAPP